MAIKKWRWYDLSDTQTSLPLLIRILNQRLKQLFSVFESLTVGGPGKIEWYFYNDGAVLIAGDSDWGYVNVACTITAAQIVTDPPGSMTVQVYTSRYPIWDAWTPISGANPLVLSAQDKAQPPITGWLTSIPEGTYMKVAVVGSVGFIKKATLTLTLEPI